MKSITYNVNGIRSATSKGFIEWLKTEDADILCLQEVKANQSQIELSRFIDLGFEHIYWHNAEKKGYSGVAILSKMKALDVEVGCGNELFDREGRVVLAHFGTFTQLCVYMPSGSSGEERQSFKMQWLEYFTYFIKNLIKKYPNLILSGDYNICHKAIDIHNPIANAKSSGFLPKEREWFSNFLEIGFEDSFRLFNKNPHQYTWWSYRAGARSKNLGWRIDYHLSSRSFSNKLTNCEIHSEVTFSDHCPVTLHFEPNLYEAK